MYDVIIIGAGPAGISASLYVKRANLSVLVLYHGQSQLEKAHKIENYYGFKNGISGAELYADGIEQAKNLGVQVVDSEVTNVQIASEKTYSVTTSEAEYECSALIIATGNKKLRPNIKGIAEFEGRGVSYCAVCDGFFYRKKNVCVIGSDRYALEEAFHLANMAESVTILTNAADERTICELLKKEKSHIPEEAIKKIAIDARAIKEVQGSDTVEGVLFADGKTLSAQGIFVALGTAGAADFAKKLGLTLNGDSIIVSEKMETNAKGVFSCGNATGGLLQVCKAVYEGGVAGLSAAEYVRSQR